MRIVALLGLVRLVESGLGGCASRSFPVSVSSRLSFACRPLSCLRHAEVSHHCVSSAIAFTGVPSQRRPGGIQTVGLLRRGILQVLCSKRGSCRRGEWVRRIVQLPSGESSGVLDCCSSSGLKQGRSGERSVVLEESGRLSIPWSDRRGLALTAVEKGENG